MAVVTAVASTHAGELARCIGRICVGKDAPTFQELRQLLESGSRARLAGLDTARTICVYNAPYNLSHVFTFSGDTPLATKRLDGIFVARGMLCHKRTTVRQPLAASTEIGLGIGDEQAMATALLGTPTRVDDAVVREDKDRRYLNSRYASIFGMTRLHYEQGPHSLLFNQFGLNAKQRIVSVWISESP